MGGGADPISDSAAVYPNAIHFYPYRDNIHLSGLQDEGYVVNNMMYRSLISVLLGVSE